MRRFDWTQLTTDEREALLRRPALADDERLQASVAAIIERVRKEGDRALRELTEELDGVRLDALRVTPDEFEKAAASLSHEKRDLTLRFQPERCAATSDRLCRGKHSPFS